MIAAPVVRADVVEADDDGMGDTRQLVVDTLADTFKEGEQAAGFGMAIAAVEKVMNDEAHAPRRPGDDPFVAASNVLDFVSSLQQAVVGGVVASAGRELGLTNGDALLAGRIAAKLLPLPLDGVLQGAALTLRAVGLVTDLEFQALGIDPALDQRSAPGSESVQVLANALGIALRPTGARSKTAVDTTPAPRAVPPTTIDRSNPAEPGNPARPTTGRRRVPTSDARPRRGTGSEAPHRTGERATGAPRRPGEGATAAPARPGGRETPTAARQVEKPGPPGQPTL